MKIFNLTKTEIKKQTKKLSFKICLIILLVLAIGLPILFKMFSTSDIDYIYTKEDLNIYQSDIIKNPKTDNEILRNELNNIMIEVINLNLKNKDKATEYNTSLYNDYSYNKMTSKVLEFMLNNKDINNEKIDEEFGLETNSYKDNTSNEILFIKEDIDKEIKNLEKLINEDSYNIYLKQEISNLKQNNTDSNKEIIKAYERFLKLNITNKNDFRINELNNIVESISSKIVVVSKKEYQKTNNKVSYENYVKITNKQNKELDNKIKKSWYAIDNNINYNKSEIKDNLNDIIINNVAFLSIIIVIISGGIVSSEFQKGTIRLLVIRPNKRWKILLSKFLTIIILTLGLALITYTASFITNGILYGFKDYFIKDLVINNNKVKEVSFILISLCKMFILLIPTLFSGLIAFFLSSVTRNTALSVGISIFLQVGYSIVAMILVLINFSYTNLTPFIYLDYSQFLDYTTLSNNFYMYNTYYSFKLANIVLLVWSIILYTISNMSFTKRDIKS